MFSHYRLLLAGTVLTSGTGRYTSRLVATDAQDGEGAGNAHPHEMTHHGTPPKKTRKQSPKPGNR